MPQMGSPGMIRNTTSSTGQGKLGLAGSPYPCGGFQFGEASGGGVAVGAPTHDVGTQCCGIGLVGTFHLAKEGAPGHPEPGGIGGAATDCLCLYGFCAAEGEGATATDFWGVAVPAKRSGYPWRTRL